MSAPEPSIFEDFATIPDPAAATARAAPPPPPALGEPAPTRRGLRLRRLAALASGLAWIALLVLRFGLRPALREPLVLVPLVAWSALAALALTLGLRPGARGLPPGSRRVQALIVALPTLYGLSVLARAEALPPSDLPLSWSTAGACFSATHLLSLGPLLLAALVLRRSFLNSAALRAALVGAVVGLAAAIGIHAHCPVEATSHILVAHGLSIVTGGLIGAALGAIRGRA